MSRSIEKHGPADAGGDRRNPAGDHPRLPVAEVDALGRRLGASPTRCAGCARCARSSARSAARTRRRRSCRSSSTASPPATSTYGHRFMAPAPIKVRRFDDYVDALQKAKVVLDADRRKEIILADAAILALAHGLELVEDEGLLEEVAGLVEWPVVLMGEFERGVPRNSARSDPRHDPRQPEMFRAARRASGKLANRFLLVSNLDRQRRRQGDRGRQRRASCARGCRTRAISGRPIWRPAGLSRRSGQAARSAARQAEGAGHRVPREARHAGRAGRAHRRAGARTGAAGRLRAGSGRARRATRQGRSRHRDGRRVPGIAGPDGPLLRVGAGRGRRTSPRRSRIITSRRGRTIASRPRRYRSRWRSPTSSIRWSASGRSTRSRREARTRMRCGARRWG